MNNLMNNVEARMTSLDVAEITEKEHKNVLADIRNEIAQLEEAGINGQLIFQPTSYVDSCNRQQTMYSFGMEGALQLGARYSAKTRHEMIQHIKKLEMERQQSKIPQTRLEWIQLALEQEKEKEKLEARNNRLIGNNIGMGINYSKEVNELNEEVEELYEYIKITTEFATIKAVESKTKCSYSWRKLKEYCVNRELEIQDAPDKTYGTVKSYPAEAWEQVYNINLTILFNA